MGLSQSKAPLERKRSQRRSLSGFQKQIYGIRREISKYKGLKEQDISYQLIYRKIVALQKKIAQKCTHLHPAVSNLYATVTKDLENTMESLKLQLNQNQQEAGASTSSPVVNSKRETVDSFNNNDFEVEEEEERPISEDVTLRETVRIEDQASPVEKRTSIIKQGGVAVLPSNPKKVTIGRPKLWSIASFPEETLANHVSLMEKQLNELEEQVFYFVGTKNDKRYKDISDTLNGFRGELSRMEPDDEEVKDKVKMCRNYISSISNLLENKVQEASKEEQDEVFVQAPVPFVVPAPEPFVAPASEPFVAPAPEPFVAPALKPFVAPAPEPFVAPASEPFVAPASKPKPSVAPAPPPPATKSFKTTLI